jgi:hypothetical protein
MTSTAAAWAPIVFSGLASGTIAAVVTTFGGQARARRKARAKILKRLRQLEIARRAAFEHFDEEGGFSLDAELIADLEARCMMAGVPLFAERTYHLACESARMASRSSAEETWVEGRPTMFALTGSFMDEAARHVAAAVWHPWLSRLTVTGECSYLRETIELAFPDISVLDNWPKMTIRNWRKAMVLRRHPLARWRIRRQAEGELAERQ